MSFHLTSLKTSQGVLSWSPDSVDMFIFSLQRCLLKEDSIEKEGAEEAHSVHSEIVLQPAFEDSRGDL